MTLDEKLQAMSPAEVAGWMREHGVKQLSTTNTRIVLSDIGLAEAAALRAIERKAKETEEAKRNAPPKPPEDAEEKISGEELYARAITGQSQS